LSSLTTTLSEAAIQKKRNGIRYKHVRAQIEKSKMEMLMLIWAGIAQACARKGGTESHLFFAAN